MAFKKAKSTDKPMTKSQVVAMLADASGMTKKDVAALLGLLTDLACAQAPAGFTLPGLGKLKLVHRKERMGRNPATGAAMKIPAKKVLKFAVSKAAKDCVCGCK